MKTGLEAEIVSDSVTDVYKDMRIDVIYRDVSNKKLYLV